MENSTAKHGTKRDSIRILLAEKKGAARRALAASSIRRREQLLGGAEKDDEALVADGRIAFVIESEDKGIFAGLEDTLKSVFDGLVYALLTAGCFGWLWPE